MMIGQLGVRGVVGGLLRVLRLLGELRVLGELRLLGVLGELRELGEQGLQEA